MLLKASGKREHGQGQKGGTLKFKTVENDLCAARHQKDLFTFSFRMTPLKIVVSNDSLCTAAAFQLQQY